MLRVAFCDDEAHYLKLMCKVAQEVFEEIDVEYDIEVFNSGEKFLRSYGEEKFDIVFLDIDMPNMDGIDLASELRKVDLNTMIVFVTGMEDRVYDAFGYNVFKFIRKSEGEAVIKKSFRECIDKVKTEKNIYLFNTKEGYLKVREDEIIYFEIELRRFYMTTLLGRYRIMVENFQEIIEILGENNSFIMPNRSALLNLRYVKCINKGNEVVLFYNHNTASFFISRNKKQEFNDRFMNYIK